MKKQTNKQESLQLWEQYNSLLETEAKKHKAWPEGGARGKVMLLPPHLRHSLSDSAALQCQDRLQV